MNQQKFIRREYLAIVKGLTEIHLTSEDTLPVKNLLRILKMGWLTPGPEILKRLESKRLTPRAVLQRPELLQKKWFHELSAHEKPRWINVFWSSTAKTQLSQVLGISKRRLQQLHQGMKLISSIEDTTGHSK
ncbi:MAG: hypothetical protein KF743_14090 [Fimbriimonadaceae bacterium]|nr:hypothetical protein [Fimbriimonadaceae bacterium]